MGDFFEWDANKYGLAIPQVDEEHERIVKAMNVLHGLHEAKAPRARLAEAMARLKAVTVQHFKDEEAYMEKIGYAELRKHRHVHKHLLDRLDGYEKEFQASGVLTEDFFLFLKMWLKSHICGIDTQYARHAHAA